MAEVKISQECHDAYKKLKFAKNPDRYCLLLKVDSESNVLVDEELPNTTLEDLKDHMSEQAPRFIIYSFKWVQKDGRFQFPIIFIHFAPSGSNMTQNMLYSRAKIPIVRDFSIQRTYELRDLDDLDDDWVLEKISKA
eukprot:GEZU01032391.1.p1 GENE.GEZU01032391.1~~GEZU01032391.1.p1  ORF type:complete len:137 (-),score=56.00 GEZU01032391.1:280-690(-)